jgi:hypothetical protein
VLAGQFAGTASVVRHDLFSALFLDDSSETSERSSDSAAEGPYATVYVDVRERGENRDQLIDLRWAALVDDLRSGGIDAPTLEAVVEAVSNHSRSGIVESIGVIARDGKVLVELHIPVEVPPSSAWGAVPSFGPALRHMPEPIEHIICVVDRTRAEIHVPQGVAEVPEVIDVDGETSLPLRKVSAGGWSMARFQNRAEEGWHQNARSMAQAIGDVARQAQAEVVILAGDVRERSLIVTELNGLHPDQEVISVEEGGLAPGAATEPLARKVEEVLQERRRHRVNDVRDRVGMGLSRDEPTALQGVAATVSAAQRAQIETLLVADRAVESDQMLWIGQSPIQIGMSREEVVSLGAQDPRQGPVVDCLTWSAVGLGADVLWADDDMELVDGVGALLRFSDASTADIANQVADRV